MDWHSGLSSSDDDEHENAEVEELLAQIMDEHILEITTTPVDTGPLAPELESRFNALKNKSGNPNPPSTVAQQKLVHEEEAAIAPGNDIRVGEDEAPEQGFHEEMLFSSPPLSSPSALSSSEKKREYRRKGRAVSPPSKSGSWSCLCVSPKQLLRSFSSKKKSVSSRKSGSDQYSDGIRFSSQGSDEFLTDVSTFSVKSQSEQLRKALKDEDRICTEAEELVQKMKHASARINMDFSDLDDLDDEDDFFKPKPKPK